MIGRRCSGCIARLAKLVALTTGWLFFLACWVQLAFFLPPSSVSIYLSVCATCPCDWCVCVPVCLTENIKLLNEHELARRFMENGQHQSLVSIKGEPSKGQTALHKAKHESKAMVARAHPLHDNGRSLSLSTASRCQSVVPYAGMSHALATMTEEASEVMATKHAQPPSK